MQIDGFKPQKRTGIQVDADSALQINVTLELGEQSETVTVSVNAVRVDTVSTQLGEVVPSATMTSLSLNGRSYTDLLSIQPGVIPTTTIQSNSVIMAGVTGPVAPSGGLNPGIVSVSGQRETANGFYVNGSDVQERMNGGTGVVPNLDSIEEFRLLTNNFDPEYGNYNGGIVNVVTKSGSDVFHGNGFEFFRNTNLDARNYFSPERAEFNQNQPGGTIGGPVKRGKIFFFADYQATRTTQGIETGNISVPSLAERAGDFSGVADQLTGTVNGSYWANLLAQKLGYGVSAGEPYYTPGCATTAQCVFPKARRFRSGRGRRPRSSCCSTCRRPMPARTPCRPARFPRRFATTRARSGSTATRLFGLLTGYYFLDDYRSTIRIPASRAARTCRASTRSRSAARSSGRLGARRRSDQNTVNDFHASLTHNANNVGVPNGGHGVSLASQGFVTGPGTPGIVVLAPQFEGVENLVFNTFTMGVTITGVNQTGDTLHLERQRLESVGCAHREVRRAVSVPAGAARAERDVQRHVHVCRHGNRIGLRRLPARRAQQLHSVVGRRLLSAQSVRRRVRAGQLARALEPDDQLRRALGHHGAVVREGQPDPDHRPRPAVGRLSRTRRSVSCSPAMPAWRAASRRRGSAICRRGSASPTSPNEKTSLRASYGLFYTAFQGCRPASCTACRRTATTT